MCVPGVRPGDGSARAELRFGELQGSREVSSRWCVRLLGRGGGGNVVLKRALFSSLKNVFMKIYVLRRRSRC